MILMCSNFNAKTICIKRFPYEIIYIKQLPGSQVRQAFRMTDEDGDSRLTAEEIRSSSLLISSLELSDTNVHEP